MDAKVDRSRLTIPAPQSTPTLTSRSLDVWYPWTLSLKWALIALPFLFLWFRLIENLHREWSTNPQYSYGWVMPVLCLGALFGRFQAIRSNKPNLAPAGSDYARLATVLFAVLAFLFLPIRLVEEATPEWRPIEWALGFVAIGLSLCAFYMAGGRAGLKVAAFPLAFFFVAIPWPTPIEQPIIQGLSRLNASLVVEVLGAIGVPAIQHGNLIEVSTGTVGVNDACSGIRSFQSSLMVALFLGELNSLSVLPRCLLVPSGFILSILFNLCRTAFLTMIAAEKGVDAIAHYHDPAGIAIMIACTVSIWVLAFFLKSKPRAAAAVATPASVANQVYRQPSWSWAVVPTLRRASVLLLVWLLAVEVSVWGWYHFREAHIVPGPNWSVSFPSTDPTLKELPISAETRELLRFDQGRQAEWQEADGTTWYGFYFEWQPGKVAGYFAKRHTPEICMPAAGRRLVAGPELMVMTINGVELPMRRYVFQTPNGSVHAYQCRWEAGVGNVQYFEHEGARYNLIRGVWAGRGIHGQKVLEIVITGYEDLEQSKGALVRQLEKLIHVEPTSGVIVHARREDSRYELQE